VPAGTGSFNVACQKYRDDSGQMVDLDSGFNATRASCEMKINDCQIGIHTIVNGSHGLSGVNGSADHRTGAKLNQ
jgi:hypothetical protein